MSHPSLPSNPNLSDVLTAFPYTVRPLLEYHDLLLRHGHSPFSVAERELIAAYVSGLNQCRFCFGAHKIIASTFGIDEQLVDRLLGDEQPEGVDSRMLPVLQFVKLLTEAPARVTEAEREAIRAAGWPDQAIFDAASICGLFNMMNRIVEGTGVTTSTAIQQQQKQRHEAPAGEVNLSTYQDYGREIGL